MLDARPVDTDLPRDLKVRIAGAASVFPEKIVSNEELAESVGIDPDWARAKLGIGARRISEAAEPTGELASQAGLAALAAAGAEPQDVGLVIVATTTPDRLTPSTACRVSQELGIEGTPAFDIGAACSGFIYALTAAAHFLEQGFRDTALVIGADALSKMTDWGARDCVYFGDGAGAALLTRSDADNAFFLADLSNDLSGYRHFTVPPDQPYFSMNPVGVYRTGRRAVVNVARRALQQAGVDAIDIDHVIPHQPSVTLLKAIAADLGVSFNKFWLHQDRYANTGAATVPIALAEAYGSGELKQGDWLLFAAVGAGMTSGAAVYRWH